VSDDDLDWRPLRERLKDACDPEEVERLLGRGRMPGYPVIAFALGATCLAFLAYMIYRALSGQVSGWALLAAPIFVLLAAAFGALSYAGAYSEITGRRWPGADTVESIARRLNSNV
jgi:hypothetical protein